MALTVSNRCVEDAQAETGKAGRETSARSRSKSAKLDDKLAIASMENSEDTFEESVLNVSFDELSIVKEVISLQLKTFFNYELSKSQRSYISSIKNFV